MSKNARFIEKQTQTNPLGNQFIVIEDTDTGINYLWMKNGTAGGITPLLDKEGKPVIS